MSTSTVGYFNPNDYPLQVVISEHNLTLHLQPKQWVVDRTGKLVNDPILDRYVGKGRLSRASDPAKALDVVILQPVNKQPPPGALPNTYQHPVYAATGFVRDGNNQMIAVQATPTAPQPAVPPPVSYNPVKAMTVEEARRLRLIKPVKNVPEEAGVADTAGQPLSGDKTPSIQYAHDLVREKAAAPAQPQAIVAQPMTEAQAALVNNLHTATALDPESPEFANQAMNQAAKALQGQPAPTVVPPPPPPPTSAVLEKLTKPLSPPPIPTNPVPTVMTPAEFPDPVLTPEPTSPPNLVVEEELAPAHPPVEPPQKAPAVPSTAPVQSGTTCPLCPGQTFSSPGYLLRHINRKHPDRVETLMKQCGLV